MGTFDPWDVSHLEGPPRAWDQDATFCKKKFSGKAVVKSLLIDANLVPIIRISGR